MSDDDRDLPKDSWGNAAGVASTGGCCLAEAVGCCLAGLVPAFGLLLAFLVL